MMRTLAGLPACLATGTQDGLQVHLAVRAELAARARVHVTARESPRREVKLALRAQAPRTDHRAGRDAADR
jgi:hypothetical protein